MKAIRIHSFGTSDVLSFDEIDKPEPGDTQICVRVAATSINPVDYKIREGKFPPVKQSDLPAELGRDIAGTIDAVGSKVTDFQVGDQVYGMPGIHSGAYAEFVLVEPGEIAKAPASLSMLEAASLPLAALTAWQGLFDHGGLKKGQRVLIHGGSGGVGHLAVQFAHEAGATVFATASGENQDFLREMGADTAINCKAERFEDTATDIDLVYDLIGGETQERSFAVLRDGGKLVSTVHDPDDDRGMVYMAEPSSGDLDEVTKLIDAGKVRIVIGQTFALENIAEAQDRLEHGPSLRGKIAVTVA